MGPRPSGPCRVAQDEDGRVQGMWQSVPGAALEYEAVVFKVA